MRRMTTEEILAESFREVAAEKPVNRITIKDIVGNCGLSPTTFYRHFRDKEDLIEWIYKKKCREILEHYKYSPRRWTEMVSEWVNACAQNRFFLINLLTNTGGHDSFSKRMAELTVRILEHEIAARTGRETIPEKDRMKLYLYATGAVRLVCAWLLGKVSVTRELAAELIAETSAPLIHALLPLPEEQGTEHPD